MELNYYQKWEDWGGARIFEKFTYNLWESITVVNDKDVWIEHYSKPVYTSGEWVPLEDWLEKHINQYPKNAEIRVYMCQDEGDLSVRYTRPLTESEKLMIAAFRLQAEPFIKAREEEEKQYEENRRINDRQIFDQLRNKYGW